MTTTQFGLDDPALQLAFSVSGGKGAFAVLIGSGLSRVAEIPTGWEITLDLIRRVALAQGASEQADWAQWYRDTSKEEPNYSKLLARLGPSPAERRAILEGYIEPDDEDREAARKVPTKAHHALAGLVADGHVRVIVTTNFDRLMENALRERGIEPTVISSVDALAGAEPLTHASCYLIKLHGDYKDARILNTDEELSAYPAPYEQLLDRVFDEYGLIVCGWSGEWDHALRAAIMRTPNRRYPVFWASRGIPGNGAAELIAQRRALTVSIIDADAFFSMLSERVQTLQASRRQNPQSVELSVNSVKRFLAKPEFGIQLEQLLTDETNRLLGKLSGEDFVPQGNWDAISFQQRIARYEGVTEAVATIAGTLGRWGDHRHLPIVLDVIDSLTSQADSVRGGHSGYLDIRGYPAVLVMTGYGLGLARSEKWELLHRLFTSQLGREDRDSKPIVAEFFLWAWKGGENGHWQWMDGLERHKTALSDHLLRVFTGWSKRFVGLEPNFELLFERFELLGSLAHLESHTKEDVSAGLDGAPQHAWTWMPVGRVGWREGDAKRLFAEMQDEGRKADLLGAGFAHGDGDFLTLFAKNFGRIAGKMRR